MSHFYISVGTTLSLVAKELECRFIHYPLLIDTGLGVEWGEWPRDESRISWRIADGVIKFQVFNDCKLEFCRRKPLDAPMTLMNIWSQDSSGIFYHLIKERVVKWVVKCGHQRNSFRCADFKRRPIGFSDMILGAPKKIVAKGMEYSRNAQLHSIDKSLITVVDILTDRKSWMNADSPQTEQTLCDCVWNHGVV